jgi:serine/threonine protein kinase
MMHPLRAPEILMGATTYSTAIDMWSVGCIFAELLLKEPLFQAKTEIELLSMIFKLLGPPTSSSWPDYSTLPLAKTITLPSPQPHQFRQRFNHMTTAGVDLLMSLLTYDPEQRISAEEAVHHPYFRSNTSHPLYMRKLTPANEVNLHSQNIQICLAHFHLLLQVRGTYAGLQMLALCSTQTS